jgi:hypothetical protein
MSLKLAFLKPISFWSMRRAMLAARARREFSSGKRKNYLSSGKKETQQDVATKLGISDTGISKAEIILEHATGNVGGSGEA